jgi:hypothetical protein
MLRRWQPDRVMRFLFLGVIPAALALVACETFNTPLSGDGSFDPLVSPGGGMKNTERAFGPAITPGQFVTASIPNTAFYKNKPKGTEDADKLLNRGTNMRIVSNDGAYVKVELDSGEVGWVPSVMVISSSPEISPVDGAYQVYPPLPDTGGLEPLPVIDPDGLPPEGAIPAIIDPDAPAPAPAPALLPTAPLTIDPVPDLKPAEPEPDAAEEEEPEPEPDAAEEPEPDAAEEEKPEE